MENGQRHRPLRTLETQNSVIRARIQKVGDTATEKGNIKTTLFLASRGVGDGNLSRTFSTGCDDTVLFKAKPT
jgi:hypothetical protein